MHLELLPIVRKRETWVSGQIYRASVHSEGIFKRVTVVRTCAVTTEYAQEGRRHKEWFGKDLSFQGYASPWWKSDWPLALDGCGCGWITGLFWKISSLKWFHKFHRKIISVANKSWPLHFQCTQLIIFPRLSNHHWASVGRTFVATEHVPGKSFTNILVVSPAFWIKISIPL